MFRAAGTIALSLLLLGASSAQALTLQQVGGSFEQPIYVTSDPGNANRLFVVEREGTIELVENGVTSQFTDLRAKVGCGGSCAGEHGLMSIALAPDFDGSGRLYVDYADDVTGAIHVEELTASGPAHETANPATLRPLFEISHSSANNHNGGQLQFGPEGNLYISTGDGGGSNDQFHNSQDLTKPLGKVLRVTPNPGGPAPFYTIPADNPFAGVPGDYAPIWSYGLRNPFRFSFDRLTGDMVIADVGQGAREEIDLAPSPAPGVVGGAGANYGWNCREGLIAGPATDLTAEGCATTPFVDPVFDYTHTPDPEAGGKSRCAIIGGYVVRDPSLGALYGHYLYTDYCSGVIRALQLPTKAGGLASGDCWTGLTVPSPFSFGEDAQGRTYVTTEAGQVYRLAGQPSDGCPARLAPVSAPAPRRFTIVGIKAQRRRVERGKAAFLTVFVSPCEGRKGQSVRLLRNGRPNGTRFLDRACTARFLPRIRRGTTFKADIREEGGYPAGESRRLKVKLAHHRRRR
jgi:hypothetical protein